MTLQFSPFKWSEKSLTTSIIILLVWGQSSKKKELKFESLFGKNDKVIIRYLFESNTWTIILHIILHVIFKWFRRQTKYYLISDLTNEYRYFFSQQTLKVNLGVLHFMTLIFSTRPHHQSLFLLRSFFSLSLSVLSLPSSHNSG